MGKKVPVTPLPEGIHFPPDYKITAMGCNKAVKRGARRVPPSKPNGMRCFDTDRCEEMYLFLTPGIRQGDPQSVRAAVSVLAHKAAINGYKSAEIEVRVAPGPSWSSVLPKEQSVALFKEAMTLLLQPRSKSRGVGRSRRSRSSIRSRLAPRRRSKRKRLGGNALQIDTELPH